MELLLPAVWVAVTEAVGTAARVTDREVGRRPCRRRLPLGARERRSNQRAVDRPVLEIRLGLSGAIFQRVTFKRVTFERITFAVA